MSLDAQLWLLALRALHEANGRWSSLHHTSFQAGCGRTVSGQTCPNYLLIPTFLELCSQSRPVASDILRGSLLAAREAEMWSFLAGSCCRRNEISVSKQGEG